MVIKEVEIQNTLQEIDGVAASSTSSTITGKLKDSGSNLVLKCTSELTPDHARIFKLDFVNVNELANSFDFVDLGTSTPRSVWTDSTEVVFNLDEVKSVIRSIDSSYANIEHEVSLEFFTAEANIVELPDVGTIRYGFPTTVDGLDNTVIQDNTDGWYQLSMLDLPIWDINNLYENGDMVISGDKVFSCIQNTIVDTDISSTDYWKEVPGANFSTYVATLNSANTYKSPLKVIADIMITRNIKSKYILPLLKKTSFDAKDDILANKALTHLTAIREAIVAYLQLGDPIRAVNLLRKIPFINNQYTRRSTTKTVLEDTRLTL